MTMMLHFHFYCSKSWHAPRLTNSTTQLLLFRCFGTDKNHKRKDSLWTTDRVNGYVGHSFPDFIEFWNRTTFQRVGYALTGTALLATGFTAISLFSEPVQLSLLDSVMAFAPAGILGSFTAGYWVIGLTDIRQTQHSIRRNYPILGNMRYILETIRPELNQYIVESDIEGRPFNRLQRARAYQRAKNVNDTLPFGTRHDLYEVHTEWINHSMYPKEVAPSTARHVIGVSNFGTTQPYSSSIFNISAMSHGAISAHAIKALNGGARLGNFSHNTGEGGVSKYHLEAGGDLVWNIGTGYFGCGSGSSTRTFEPSLFQETLQEAQGQVKMIEIKLSQGAKPGHGGLLPKSKITREIAATRKLEFPPVADCHSPVHHSAFRSPLELIQFISNLRELSGGLPVGIKLCVGQPEDIVRLVKLIAQAGQGPDFFTIDGAEGGTGAAPHEFSDYVGTPLEDGLIFVRDVLTGANLNNKISIICSGKIISGFKVVHYLSLGANACNSARGFMFSLGCIQALKCNTNRCPTGIATQDEELMYGLDPEEKTVRVFNFHSKTVKTACEIVGAIGLGSIEELHPQYIMRRVSANKALSFDQIFPLLEPGCLLKGMGPSKLQLLWDKM